MNQSTIMTDDQIGYSRRCAYQRDRHDVHRGVDDNGRGRRPETS